jgi:hypothetical protein
LQRLVRGLEDCLEDPRMKGVDAWSPAHVHAEDICKIPIGHKGQGKRVGIVRVPGIHECRRRLPDSDPIRARDVTRHHLSLRVCH